MSGKCLVFFHVDAPRHRQFRWDGDSMKTLDQALNAIHPLGFSSLPGGMMKKKGQQMHTHFPLSSFSGSCLHLDNIGQKFVTWDVKL